MIKGFDVTNLGLNRTIGICLPSSCTFDDINKTAQTCNELIQIDK